MRRTMAVAAVLLALGLAAGGAEAAKVRVVASLPDLKALTEAVGGDLVDVDTLARPAQNPHDIEVRPSLMLKLRRADLLVRNGVGVDPWVEPLVVGSQNSGILPGAAGYVDASRGVRIIEPTGPVDRSRGDVHPEGNPHYTLDPATADVVTANILDGLKRVAPELAERFEAQRRQFLERLQAAMQRWQPALAPARGARVVTYHEIFTYFLARFGLVQAGAIEDRPGIPPSPSHLAALIRTIREERVRAIVAEPFADQRTVQLVARESGARVVALPASVGAARGTDSYIDFIDHLVTRLAEALR
ncbi:MAG: metal ABC transporter substrate-binding protein [Candidatus Rokuibacteriota bacterium]